MAAVHFNGELAAVAVDVGALCVDNNAAPPGGPDPVGILLVAQRPERSENTLPQDQWRVEVKSETHMPGPTQAYYPRGRARLLKQFRGQSTVAGRCLASSPLGCIYTHARAVCGRSVDSALTRTK